MREINEHKIDKINEGLTVSAVDEPAEGGANRQYLIQGTVGGVTVCNVLFTDGTKTGVTNESLLAIVRDRLTGFQNGPGACKENAVAKGHLESAMRLLAQRAQRIAAAEKK